MDFVSYGGGASRGPSPRYVTTQAVQTIPDSAIDQASSILVGVDMVPNAGSGAIMPAYLEVVSGVGIGQTVSVFVRYYFSDGTTWDSQRATSSSGTTCRWHMFTQTITNTNQDFIRQATNDGGVELAGKVITKIETRAYKNAAGTGNTAQMIRSEWWDF